MVRAQTTIVSILKDVHRTQTLTHTNTRIDHIQFPMNLKIVRVVALVVIVVNFIFLGHIICWRFVSRMTIHAQMTTTVEKNQKKLLY